MRIEVSHNAREQLREIDQKYYQISEALAEKMLIEVDETLIYITKRPASGINYGKRYKMFPLKRFPYILICEIKKPVITVNSILHERRHPKHRTTRRK